VFADLATVLPFRKRRKSKSATFGTVSSQEELYEAIPIRTEDHASVLVRFNDGARGVFTVSQVSAGRKNRLSFEVNGSIDSVFWNQEEPEKIWIGHRNH
jgi:predicted dehydrogenase